MGNRVSKTGGALASYSVSFVAKTPAAFERAARAVQPYMDAHFEDWSADFATSGRCQVVAYVPKMTRDDAVEIAAMLDPVCKKTAKVLGGARSRGKTARTVRSLPSRKSSRPKKPVRTGPRGTRRGGVKKSTLPGRSGSLHRALGVPDGKKISIAKLRTAARGRGVLAARARRALNLRGVRTKDMRRKS